MVVAFAPLPLAAQQSPSPQDFAREAAISNAFELQAAELAVEQGKDANAIAFAQDMLRDHGRASADLEEAAKTDGISIPTELDERRKKQLDALRTARDADFDQAYLSTQMTAHEEAVALFDVFAKSGNAGALKTFAQRTIGTLRMHNIRVHDLTDQR
ncbi:DUF4142 domain-containing protein [Pararhizobium arenae]|uniref:DUF4142 domain-containing protein n=1 Tax=Pararhizobium arenae TaxID=1856850 RepID=UPI001AEC8AC3|nr:DUF4142 domain-containing protein [Pararhizobium arenae]